MIELSNLSVSRDNTTEVILKSITLQIPQGCSCALLGANGAGKTTLLLSLVGLAKILSGEAIICGTKLEKKNLRKIRNLVGLVFQNSDYQLFCTDVNEDIRFGLKCAGLNEDEIEQKAITAIEKLGIGNILARTPDKLSEGEKKLAAICTVIASQAQILLLDEPSAQLDPRTKRNLTNTINSLPHTKIISTHDIQFAQSTCQYAIILNEGKLAAYGKLSDILSNTTLLEDCGLV